MWFSPLVKLGAQRPLQASDLYSLEHENSSRVIVSQFDRNWLASIQKMLVWPFHLMHLPFINKTQLLLWNNTLKYTCLVFSISTFCFYGLQKNLELIIKFLFVRAFAIIYTKTLISVYDFRERPKMTYDKRSSKVGFYRTVRPKASVIPALFKTFGRTFLLGAILKLCQNLIMFINPQLLK